VGAAAALGTAFFAAGTNLLLRRQVAQLGGATAQTWRAVVGTLLFLVIFLAFRDPRQLLTLPIGAVGVLLTSVLLNMVIGDLLQYAAITRLGIALAMPIVCSYPLVTLLIASITLAEIPTPLAVVGTMLVVGGVILVALPRRAIAATGETRHLAPAGHWVGVALNEIDILAANMLRLPFGALLCAIISVVQRRQPPWQVQRQNLVPLCLAGVTGLGSSICFLVAIQLVGAATTATLNAAAPIFGLLGAVFFLGERPTRRNVVGTLIAFVGITLVV
jgi:drug/metabolite transporter (DMT)-like permease